MGKGSGKRKNGRTPKRQKLEEDFMEKDMDDEIDAFHRQRDIIPLDVNDDTEEFDEDTEQPVFAFEDDEKTSEDDEDDNVGDEQLTGLAAKIARQQKFLQQKMGGADDEMDDDDNEEVEEKKAIWGRKKHMYYSADNIDYELQSSDEELPAEEETEVLRLQKERAKSLRMEDFGIDDPSEDNSEYDSWSKDEQDAVDVARGELGFDADVAFEEVKKDLNALSKEEQMDVVYSSAPELVGLLAELNEALSELENKVRPLLKKLRDGNALKKGGMHYLEFKELVLLTYCQAISFYLLLKSEGHPVRDHPILVRLLEVKHIQDKIKQIEGGFQLQVEEILSQDLSASNTENNEKLLCNFEPSSTIDEPLAVEEHEQKKALVSESSDLVNVKLSTEDVKLQNKIESLAIQSKKMLEIRASLEEKLKQKVKASPEEKLKRKVINGSSSLKSNASEKHLKHLALRQFETLDDFDDEVHDLGVPRSKSNVDSSSLHHPKTLSQIAVPKVNKHKFISGDDDLPSRDDIGERRRKYDLRVLSMTEVESNDDIKDESTVINTNKFESEIDSHDDRIEESEDEFYKDAKSRRKTKLLAKAALYSRTPLALPEETELVGSKRRITSQMEKNRGLTRTRNKQTKIPRKKYKLKHKKAVVRRKGQVREIRRPTGSYSGETTGINTNISRSIRLKA